MLVQSKVLLKWKSHYSVRPTYKNFPSLSKIFIACNERNESLLNKTLWVL